MPGTMMLDSSSSQTGSFLTAVSSDDHESEVEVILRVPFDEEQDDDTAAKIHTPARRKLAFQHELSTLDILEDLESLGDNSVIRLEAVCRMLLAMNWAQRRREAILFIQRCWRGYSSRSRNFRECQTIRRIQNAVKAHYAKERHRPRSGSRSSSSSPVLEAKKEAEKRLQRIPRVASMRQGWRRLRAAQCIQRYWRGHQSRCQYSEIRRTILMLAGMRSRKDRKTDWKLEAKKQTQKKLRAVGCIQRYLRGYHCRSQRPRFRKRLLKARAENRQRRNHAACVIQKEWRAFRLRHPSTPKVKAGRRKQRLRRNISDEKKESSIHARESPSIFPAQAEELGHLVELWATVQLGAAQRIQRFWRGHVDRKAYLDQIGAVIKVQSIWRAFWAKKRAKRRLDAVLCIQQRWSGYKSKLEATEMVQNVVFYRASRQTQAAYCIQRHWRGHRQRKVFACMRRGMSMPRNQGARTHQHDDIDEKAQSGSAISAQRYPSGSCERQAPSPVRTTPKARVDPRLASAICIQRYWRGYLDRRTFAATRRSLIVLQSAPRAFCSKRSTQSREEAMQLVGRWRASRAQKDTKASERGASQYIQTYWRGATDYKAYNQAARKIQNQWHAFLARRDYLVNLWSIVLVQTLIRVFFARKEARARLDAIKVIQSCWKGERKGRKVEQQAACCIQGFWRTYACRKAYTSTLRSIVLTQCAVRGFLARKHATARRQSSRVVQHASTLQSIVLTQCIVRGFLARKHATARRESSRVVQHASTLRSIVLTQCFVRGFLARRHATARRESSRVVQQASTLRSVVLTQCIVRGFLARKHTSARRESSRVVQPTSQEARTDKFSSESVSLKSGSASTTIESASHLSEFVSVPTERASVQTESVTHYSETMSLHSETASLGSESPSLHSEHRVERYWRPYVARRPYGETRRLAVHIQCLARVFLARREAKARLEAIQLIQRCWRGARGRRIYGEVHGSIVQRFRYHSGLKVEHKTRDQGDRESSPTSVMDTWANSPTVVRQAHEKYEVKGTLAYPGDTKIIGRDLPVQKLDESFALHEKAALLKKGSLDAKTKVSSSRQNTMLQRTSAIALFVLAVLGALVAIAASKFPGILSRDGLCSPIMPGTQLSNDPATYEAPWWAPSASKESTFNIFCGGRKWTRLDWSKRKDGTFQLTVAEASYHPSTKDRRLHSASLLAESIGLGVADTPSKLLVEERRLQSASVFSDRMVVIKKNGSKTTLEAAWGA